MRKVVLIKAESYDVDEIRSAVTRGMDLLGGAEKFARPGQRVLLKPNMLVGEVPDKCVTTHSAVFRAVAELFIQTGASLSFGDSPAIGSPTRAAKKAGLFHVAEELGIPEADFRTPVDVFYEKGVQNRKFVIAKAVLDNDVVVSLPKLKTHGFQKYTGCVKNQFGCIPGLRKGEYHVKLPNADDFARMLVDLNEFVKPVLYIMDGIMAMEGNGPRGGKPRKMGVLLFSEDPIALDATACRLIDLDPELVPTIRCGHQAGAGKFRQDEIELAGDDFSGFRLPDFDISRRPLDVYRPRGIRRFLNNRLIPKPVIVKEKCLSCGECVALCPTKPKSVNWETVDRTVPPVHNYGTCIRCYCCQEICPEGAIILKRPLFRRLVGS